MVSSLAKLGRHDAWPNRAGGLSELPAIHQQQHTFACHAHGDGLADTRRTPHNQHDLTIELSENEFAHGFPKISKGALIRKLPRLLKGSPV